MASPEGAYSIQEVLMDIDAYVAYTATLTYLPVVIYAEICQHVAKAI